MIKGMDHESSGRSLTFRRRCLRVVVIAFDRGHTCAEALDVGTLERGTGRWEKDLDRHTERLADESERRSMIASARRDQS